MNGVHKQIVSEQCVNFVYAALQDSNRRRVYINHDTRMVSLQRPRQEQLQDSTMRTFLPRMHSVEEEEVKMEIIKGHLNTCFRNPN